jgi:hypothetical protein
MPRFFLLVCLAQVVSLTGNELTAFGLGVWAYQRTGETAVYGWVALAALGPGILASPIVGVVIDRCSPRGAMLAGHAGAALCTLSIALLVKLEALGTGAVLALVSLASIFNALQLPGLSAATTLLVPRGLLGRANGVAQFGMGIAQVFAPVLAGMLLERKGLGFILGSNAVTSSFAIAVLLALRLRPASSGSAGRMRPSVVWAEALEGWRYIHLHPGLRGLLLLLAAVNFCLATVQVLLVPLVLRFSDAQALGLVLSIGGVGMLGGSGLLMAWGGPRRRMIGVLGGVFLQGLILLLGGLRPSVPLVAAGAFGAMFFIPFIFGCSQALLQSNVPIPLQGRVFAIRFMVSQAAMPVAYLLAGPIADGVFEPLMAERGLLAGSIGSVLGVGPGRGIGLMFMLLGGLGVMTATAGLLTPSLRQLGTSTFPSASSPPEQ